MIWVCYWPSCAVQVMRLDEKGSAVVTFQASNEHDVLQEFWAQHGIGRRSRTPLLESACGLKTKAGAREPRVPANGTVLEN